MYTFSLYLVLEKYTNNIEADNKFKQAIRLKKSFPSYIITIIKISYFRSDV